MPLLLARTRYDRASLMSRASKARARGRRRKAIELYSQVLRAEPDNDELRKRVATLCAQRRCWDDARAHFERAASGLAHRGFEREAIGVYKEALGFMPRAGRFWSALATLQAKQECVADAVASLRQGARALRAKPTREEAVKLLHQAHALAPRDVEVALDFASLLARVGRRADALGLLGVVARTSRGRDLRRLRRRQLRIRPTPAAFWRWLVASPATG
jgi:tetratricopeptide (TPR) repeat protein